MPVNAIGRTSPPTAGGWLQNNRKVLRGMDYTFAGVFSIFAVKIFFTQSR
jgi:threonine/homoserine/homoserine lactone efflux protein